MGSDVLAGLASISLELWVAIGALYVAVRQTRISVRQSRYTEALLHIRDVRAALQRVRHRGATELQTEYLSGYDTDEGPSGDARLYLEFVDALDLLVLSYRRRFIDRRIVREYLRPMLANPFDVPVQFLHDLRKLSKEPADYEHLEYLIREMQPRRLERIGQRIRASREAPGSGRRAERDDNLQAAQRPATDPDASAPETSAGPKA